MKVDIEGTRKIIDAATTGPWSIRVNDDGTVTVLDANGMWVAECGETPHDAALIAVSRVALPAALDELEQVRAECHGRRFDPNLVKEVAELRSALQRARAAAQVYVERVDALGLAADDKDPNVMATAEPLGEAQANLYAALGLLKRDASGKVDVVPPVETVAQLRAERDSARMLAEVRGRDAANARVSRALDGFRSILKWLAQHHAAMHGLLPYQVDTVIEHIGTEIKNLEASAPFEPMPPDRSVP